MGFNTPTALMAMQGAGVVSSAVGGYYAANAQKGTLETQAYVTDRQADLARVNAQLSESQAQVTLLAGQRQEQNVMLKTAQLKSTQRASMAARGVDLGSTTPVAILTTTDLMGRADVDAVHTNAVRQAWGYRTQATNYTNDALMLNAKATGMRATADGVSPGMTAFNSLLTGAAGMASSYFMMNKVGAFKETPSVSSKDSVSGFKSSLTPGIDITNANPLSTSGITNLFGFQPLSLNPVKFNFKD